MAKERTVTVYRGQDIFMNQFRVELRIDGEIQKKLEYRTDDGEDALKTSKEMLKPGYKKRRNKW